jgi:hypothetical protein
MKIIQRCAAQDDFRAAPDRVMAITQGRHRLLPVLSSQASVRSTA